MSLATLINLHNAKLAKYTEHLRKHHADVNVIEIDMDGFWSDFLRDPSSYNRKYGINITNTTSSCLQMSYAASLANTFTPKNIADVTTAAKHSKQQAQKVMNGLTRQLGGITQTRCDNPNEYVFWDSIHPTAVTHHVVAQLLLEKMQNSNLEF